MFSLMVRSVSLRSSELEEEAFEECSGIWTKPCMKLSFCLFLLSKSSMLTETTLLSFCFFADTKSSFLTSAGEELTLFVDFRLALTSSCLSRYPIYFFM